MGTFSRFLVSKKQRAFKEGVIAYRRGLYGEAIKSFRIAAARGSSGAQFNLGLIYATGEGVTIDYEEALGHFRQAAAQGNSDAQYSIALLYANGQGVTKDLAEAKRWFKLAAAQGHQRAQQWRGDANTLGRVVDNDHEELTTIAGLSMNKRQRYILVAVGVVVMGMTLYPPYYYPRGPSGGSVRHGFDWLLGSGQGRVEVELLIVQLLVVGIIGLIAYVLSADKKP